jgi:hypothetical protein
MTNHPGGFQLRFFFGFRINFLNIKVIHLKV